jgi:hypothetical protein
MLSNQFSNFNLTLYPILFMLKPLELFGPVTFLISPGIKEYSSSLKCQQRICIRSGVLATTFCQDFPASREY